MSEGTRILRAADVTRCLPPEPCREAVERAFAELAAGRTPAPRALGFEAGAGVFHVKAARSAGEAPRFVAKVNGNFPGNPARRGLPTIQGLLILADALDGRPLAVMDSGTLTAIRTAAASAVATRHLATRDGPLAIVGCGLQGVAHLEALLALHAFPEVRLFDTVSSHAERLAARHRERSDVPLRIAASAREAAAGAAVVATCTPGTAFVLGEDDVAPGTLVAAVGADNPRKREIHPALMRRARVVVDDLAQCAADGDLHHAIEAGLMRAQDAHADLGAVVAGTRPGREDARDIIVFDSTGIAIEDAAAADLAYRRACEADIGTIVRFGAAEGA